jgi:hypothetical protein
VGAHQRFQAAGVFSAPLRGDRSVIVAAGEDRPSNAGQLVGHGDDNDVLWRSGIECIEPGSDRCSIALDPQNRSSRAMDQDFPQVEVAPLTDA